MPRCANYHCRHAGSYRLRHPVTGRIVMGHDGKPLAWCLRCAKLYSLRLRLEARRAPGGRAGREIAA